MKGFQRNIIIALSVIFGAFLWLLHSFPAVTTLIILSFATVYVAGEFVERIQRKEVRFFVIVVFCLSLYLLMAAFILSLTGLVHRLSTADFSQFPYASTIENYLPKLKERINLVAVTAPLAEVSVYSIIYPVLTFFLLKESTRIRKGLMWFVPNRYFEAVLNLSYHVNKRLKAYFRGLLVQIAAYSIVCTLGTIWLVPKYAPVLGLVAGIANLIPFFGTVFNYLVFVLVLFFFAGKTGIITGVVTVSAAQFVDMIVYPVAFSRALSVPSGLIIIAVLLWGKFFGTLGMLLSVPFTALMQAIFVEFGRTLKHYRI